MISSGRDNANGPALHNDQVRSKTNQRTKTSVVESIKQTYVCYVKRFLELGGNWRNRELNLGAIKEL